MLNVLSALDAILDTDGAEEAGSDEVATGSVDSTKMEEVRGVGDVLDNSLDKLNRQVVHGGTENSVSKEHLAQDGQHLYIRELDKTPPN